MIEICLGRKDQSEIDYRWHRCGVISLRLVGSSENAAAKYIDDVHYNGPYRVIHGAIMTIYNYDRALDACRSAYGSREKCAEVEWYGVQANRANNCFGTLDDAGEADKRWHTCGPRSLRFDPSKATQPKEEHERLM